MDAKAWRKIFLVLFAITWLMTVALFWAAELYIWAVLWAVIIGTVLGFEVYAMVTGKKKSISTRLGYVLKDKPLIGWSIIASMVASWGFLILHLSIGR